jgi:hypothetical protein
MKASIKQECGSNEMRAAYFTVFISLAIAVSTMPVKVNDCFLRLELPTGH